MTAAQKKNAERFKKAAAEAKKLRKKNPKLTQAQAVKQAWAILYKTGKVAAVKKKIVKKKATKKTARKKATAKSYHKDTKSHNVRISVVSGFDRKQQALKDLHFMVNRLNDYKNVIDRLSKKKASELDKFEKHALSSAKYSLKNIKEAISKLKKNL